MCSTASSFSNHRMCEPTSAVYFQQVNSTLMSPLPSNGSLTEVGWKTESDGDHWCVSALSRFHLKWCHRPCTNPSLCARLSPAIHSVHKLKPYLLFPPSDALTVTLVIHSVLILYYYANNIIISTVNWKWSLFQQQTVQQWQQIWQRGIRGNIWHGCLLFWMPEGCALAARSQMFILAGSTDAACVTDQLLWIVKFWCHYLSDENKRVEPQRRHSAALSGRADPLFFWSPQFEDSIFAVWALIWSVFGALGPVFILHFCNWLNIETQSTGSRISWSN